MVDILSKHTQENSQAVQKMEREMPARIMEIHKNANQGVISQVETLIQNETEERHQEISQMMQNCGVFHQKFQGSLQVLETKILEINELARQALVLSQKTNGAVHGVGQGLHEALTQVTGQVQAQSETSK